MKKFLVTIIGLSFCCLGGLYTAFDSGKGIFKAVKDMKAESGEDTIEEVTSETAEESE